MTDLIFPIEIEPHSPSVKTAGTTKRTITKVRWDKTHPMKFPVTLKQEMEIRKLWKLHKDNIELIRNETITMTRFTTMLLRFSLRNPHIIVEQPYEDTGTYKTVKPNQIEYDMIGGLNGMAIQWTVSERRALTYIMESALTHLRNGGVLNYESLEPIKPFK